jgi:hypothetical protein
MPPADKRLADLAMLRAMLASEKLPPVEREAFGDMLERLEKYPTLTDRQRAYVRDVGERLEILQEYENGISNGTVPRGREVELMVKDKPLRPPGRKGPNEG